MFTMAVADGYLDANLFHDLKIPKAPGRRAIKIVTTDQSPAGAGVPAAGPPGCWRPCGSPAVSGSARPWAQPADLDSDVCVLEVARSVVKVSRGIIRRARLSWSASTPRTAGRRRDQLDRPVVELVRRSRGRARASGPPACGLPGRSGATAWVDEVRR